MTLSERKIHQIIRKVGYRRGFIKSNASLTQDLGFDKVDILQMINMLEYQFNMLVNDKDIPKLNSVHSLIEYVNHQNYLKN